jgi:NAD(P)H-hydrate epimerase
MITPLESRVLDANSEALGVPVKELMGNAGRAVADFLKDSYPGKKVMFVCGTGNNGGDGFAAALLMDPGSCKVALLKKASGIRTAEAREYYSVLECPIVPYSREELDWADVIVDCALGTGISGEVHEPYKGFIEAANGSGRTIISVDVPSGFGTGTAISPVATVTFYDMKTGMESGCGKVVVADIGIPEEASRYVGPGDMLRYPVPEPDSHKGRNGRLLVISGGPYFGAPVLASMSALRTGADLVHVCVPESVFDIVASSCPVAIGTRLPGDHLTSQSVDRLLEMSSRYDAVLIGPGLGDAQDTLDAVRAFVERCDRPMVIDADGLKAVRGMRLHDAVLTPHHGEFASLDDGSGIGSMSEKMDATILLKGREDMICHGKRCRINRTGNAGMTGGGTGDVLAGCTAALLSKGMAPFDAACLAAYICGSAGDRAFADKSYGLTAMDVLEEIPHVLRDGLR